MWSWFDGGDDSMASVVVPVTIDFWLANEKTGKAESGLSERALLELKVKYHYKEDELDVVSNDPVYMESVRSAYQHLSLRARKQRRIPRTVRIEFQRLGTRKKNNGESHE